MHEILHYLNVTCLSNQMDLIQIETLLTCTSSGYLFTFLIGYGCYKIPV